MGQPTITTPLQPVDAPKRNIFTSLQANPVGTWDKVVNEAPAAQFVNNAAKRMNVGQVEQHAEVTPPYEAGVKVVKQPVMPEDDSKGDVAGMDYLSSMFTSPVEEEKKRKATVANMKITAIGDALRHIGNIHHAVNYAPAQQLNSPTTEEYQRYQQGKAVRDAANLHYYTYQRQRAEQERRARQWEQELAYKDGMLKHYQDQDRRLWEKDAETAIYHGGLIGLRNQKMKLDDDFRNKRITIDEYNARSRRISAMASAARANGGGSGSRVSGGKGMDEYTTTTETNYKYDKLGNKIGSTTTKKRTVNGKLQPTQTKERKKLPGQENTGKKKKQLP